MAISFNSIPADWPLPLYYVEVDPSQAGRATIDQPALLVGQKLTVGSAPSNIPVAVGSLQQARTYFGVGSMLERMVAAFLAVNSSTEIWCLPLGPAGTGATGQIAITGTATAAGILTAYIAGQRVQAVVASGDTATVVGGALATAISAISTLPVTAVNTTGTVALTSKWLGLTGNDIHVALNLGGNQAKESTPAGLAVAITAMSGGTGAPLLTNGLAALADDRYEYVALPFTDATSLNAIEGEFGFGDNGRWGWRRQLFGHLFTAARGTYSTLLALGASRNSGVTSILGLEADTPAPPWEVAAAYAAQAARALTNDPARPLQTLPLTGIRAAAKGSRFSSLERSVLAKSGIAVQDVRANGTMQISREQTTYTLDAYGVGDTAYGVVTTLATLARIIRNQRQIVTSKFGRHKLANNGTAFGPGQAIVTPNIVKAELIAQYAADQELGLVENLEAFKANLIVERDPSNNDRLNVLYPPDLINQLRIFAVLAQFRLQYPASADAVSA